MGMRFCWIVKEREEMIAPLSQELRFRLLRLKKAICERFNESHWRELGLYTGCTEIINGEDRLYRSLSFNDPVLIYPTYFLPRT